MKIFKSIKWRLQIWYGLILVVVLAGFGFTAYQLERNRQFGRIDQELHRRINILANALHRPPPRGQASGDALFEGPPRGQFAGDGPPSQLNRPRSFFHLSSEDGRFFGTNDPNGFYFKIEMEMAPDRHDTEIARSDNYPKQQSGPAFDNYFVPVNHMETLPGKQPAPPRTINFQEQRVTENILPSGELFTVGCSIAPELKELRLVALTLAGVGTVIWLLGLAVGGWMVSRAIQPIQVISATAVKIAAGDLSQRINVAETESELGQLAAVLNSTFARLESAFAQQQRFAADAAHELRTPVSVMLAQTQTALGRERDAASYKLTVEACERAAQRMRKLIESLLALARFDAVQEGLQRLPFEFSKTISDCAELVQPLADERGVKIHLDLSPLEITGDAERLAQVVTNLLTNAIQYNQPDGEMGVRLERRDGLAVLEISNSGRGIAAEDLPRVFERFYRADRSRTGGGSAGLGLSICKAIVEAHGGTIEAASEAGAGTTFTVRLPVGKIG